ncbi:MAG: TetR/AcrR family transcriptional regulator [Deltaproteobacteria bacterium]|nr:TetR/AcrR family transcriptional regulator [Deltaproteobacteria bacterium]
MTTHRDEEQRREQILAATARCVIRLGYHGATIDAIAREAGLSKGAVYWYFSDKEEVLVALSSAVWAANIATMRSLLARPGPFESFARELGERFIEITMGKDDLYRLFFEFWAMGDMSKALARTLYQNQRLMEAVVAERVQVAIDAGELRADLDPATVALSYIALFNGLAVRHAFDSKVDARRCWQQASSSLYRGVAAE